MNMIKRKSLFIGGIILVIFICLFGVMVWIMEESWDLEGAGQITKVIDGNTIEITSEGKKVLIDLAFIDTPSPSSLHGEEAISHIKKQSAIFKKAYFRVKKHGDRYIGEVHMSGGSWNLSLNHQLISRGLARVTIPQDLIWKEVTIDEYIKAEKLTKKSRIGVWAYSGYVTSKGFNQEIEKQLIRNKQIAAQKKKHNIELKKEEKQAFKQMIKNNLQVIKNTNPIIAFTHHTENPGNFRTSYLLRVNVYVKEEKWANMSQSQKLSFVVNTNKKVEDSFRHYPPIKQGGSTIVKFYSDTAKDLLAEEKFIRLYGHKWRIIR